VVQALVTWLQLIEKRNARNAMVLTGTAIGQ